MATLHRSNQIAFVDNRWRGLLALCMAVVLAAFARGNDAGHLNPDSPEQPQADHTPLGQVDHLRMFPKLTDLPPRLQEEFRRRASDFIRVGDVIWSIEVQNRYERLKQNNRPDWELEPFEKSKVPNYYDFVAERSCRTLGEVVGLTPGLVWITGRITQVVDDGVLFAWGNRSGFLVVNPRGLADDDYFSMIAREVGTYSYITVMGARRTVPQYLPADDAVQPVTPEELYEYFLRHRVRGFPLLMPRKIIDEPAKKIVSSYRSGGLIRKKVIGHTEAVYHYEWINRPLVVDLPRVEPPLVSESK